MQIEIPNVKTLQPIASGGLTLTDQARQRYTVAILEESESAFVGARLWPIDLTPEYYDKTMWEEYASNH